MPNVDLRIQKVEEVNNAIDISVYNPDILKALEIVGVIASAISEMYALDASIERGVADYKAGRTKPLDLSTLDVPDEED